MIFVSFSARDRKQIFKFYFSYCYSILIFIFVRSLLLTGFWSRIMDSKKIYKLRKLCNLTRLFQRQIYHMYKSYVCVCVWVGASIREWTGAGTHWNGVLLLLFGKTIKKCLSHKKGFDIRPGVHFNIEYSFKLHNFRR